MELTNWQGHKQGAGAQAHLERQLVEQQAAGPVGRRRQRRPGKHSRLRGVPRHEPHNRQLQIDHTQPLMHDIKSAALPLMDVHLPTCSQQAGTAASMHTSVGKTCRGAIAAGLLTRWSCRLMAVTSAAMATRERSSALSGATIQTSCVQRWHCCSVWYCPVLCTGARMHTHVATPTAHALGMAPVLRSQCGSYWLLHSYAAADASDSHVSSAPT
jgi:hypothetical protein